MWQRPRPESREAIFSCHYPPLQKWNEVDQELNNQTERNQDARKIRRQPAWIMHYLEHGALVVAVEAGLIVGFARIAQRVVHINVDFAFLARVRPLQQDAAGK